MTLDELRTYIFSRSPCVIGFHVDNAALTILIRSPFQARRTRSAIYLDDTELAGVCANVTSHYQFVCNDSVTSRHVA